MKRYAQLFLGLLLLGIALVGLGHIRRADPKRPPAASLPAARDVALEIGAAGMSPSSVTVPKGVRVRLSVANRSPRAVRFALSGYQDRLLVLTLGPGESARREFVADRPGEDFAWLVDGSPQGRFEVAGSHLAEGHQ